MLLYFKHYDFFVENINAIFGTDIILLHLVLPLGISFFTFQQLAFIIDNYHQEVPKYDFLNYALFVTFFPQLIDGPIVNHNELVLQLQDIEKRILKWQNISGGLYMFTLGLAKKF